MSFAEHHHCVSSNIMSNIRYIKNGTFTSFPVKERDIKVIDSLNIVVKGAFPNEYSLKMMTLLSANPTKWLNTLTQFVGNSRRIV